LALIWRGEPGTHVKAAFTGNFAQRIFSLSTEEALMALRIAKRNQGTSAAADPASPVQAGQIYEDVASRLLAEHVLGQQRAAALLGWPAEDVLYGYRASRIQLDRAAMLRLVKAIEADAAMEDIEQLLGQEPLLAYRFLRYVNSAGAGLRREIDALRQGLMVLGLGRLKTWLHEQMPHASSDRNLRPVHTAMALRARLMASFLDAGESDALRRELYLCGLLSQIDQLLAEPLASALGALPLPTRVNAALLSQEGPYWPYLTIASALEGPDTAASHALCDRHELDQEDVNRYLLRTLATPFHAAENP
jgi:EAL and modified HD-GYP domain-containing signal transduction protein